MCPLAPGAAGGNCFCFARAPSPIVVLQGTTSNRAVIRLPFERVGKRYKKILRGGFRRLPVESASGAFLSQQFSCRFGLLFGVLSFGAVWRDARPAAGRVVFVLLAASPSVTVPGGPQNPGAVKKAGANGGGRAAAPHRQLPSHQHGAAARGWGCPSGMLCCGGLRGVAYRGQPHKMRQCCRFV